MTQRHDPNDSKTTASETQPLLAPLNVGDRIPWQLDRSGEPRWLTVVSVDGPGIYQVRYPDGHVEPLNDSE